MPALKFHELRHTFGTLAASGFDLVNVQFMMGHADSRTTARYLHARPADDDAARLSKNLGAEPPRKRAIGGLGTTGATSCLRVRIPAAVLGKLGSVGAFAVSGARGEACGEVGPGSARLGAALGRPAG